MPRSITATITTRMHGTYCLDVTDLFVRAELEDLHSVDDGDIASYGLLGGQLPTGIDESTVDVAESLLRFFGLDEDAEVEEITQDMLDAARISFDPEPHIARRRRQFADASTGIALDLLEGIDQDHRVQALTSLLSRYSFKATAHERAALVALLAQDKP